MEKEIMGYDISTFLNGLQELEIQLSEKQIRKFLQFYEMLIEKNKVMNLTSVTDFQEVVSKHFIDSLSIVTVIDPIDFEKMIDIGTGAGFPGIPLKIAYPHLRMVLVDSLNKRVEFLKEVIQKLELKNIQVVHGRAEELAQMPRYREKFDICVSRAVASLPVLSEYCLPFVDEGGLFIAYKGKDVENECRQSDYAVDTLGGVIADLVEFTLPDTDMDRSLIVIEKEEHTPKAYPRKAGMPEKKPLKN